MNETHNPAPKAPLPFMKTMDDALAVSQRENDNFYVTAFMIEAWLGNVTCRTVAQYAEHKNATNRRLQQGLAAESFAAVFGHVSDAEFHHLFGSLARFGEFDDCQSRVLARAYWMMALESPVCAWPEITPPLNAGRIAAAVAFMRGLVHRLGKWVEAIAHGVRADPAYGEDSQLYRAMGFVPLSQRQSGLTRKTPEAPAAGGVV